MSEKLFSYDYLNDVQLLKETQLPPYDAYCSALKAGQNLLEVEYNSFQNLMATGKYNELEALKKLGLKAWAELKTGPHKYADLQELSTTEGVENLQPYVSYYNSIDVHPFVQATEKVMELYRDEGICVFKESQSLPVQIHRYLHSTKDSDLFWLMKTQLVGGASTIIHIWLSSV